MKKSNEMKEAVWKVGVVIIVLIIISVVIGVTYSIGFNNGVEAAGEIIDASFDCYRNWTRSLEGFL